MLVRMRRNNVIIPIYLLNSRSNLFGIKSEFSALAQENVFEKVTDGGIHRLGWQT